MKFLWILAWIVVVLCGCTAAYLHYFDQESPLYPPSLFITSAASFCLLIIGVKLAERQQGN